MHNLYQGGGCNPNTIASSNQYKRALNIMSQGSQNPQRLMQMSQQGQSYQDQIKQRQLAFQTMNQGWGHANKEHQQKMQMINGMMNQQYQNAMNQQQQIIIMQQQQWQRSQEQMKAQEWKMQQEFEQISLAQQAEKWKNQLNMENTFEEIKLNKEEEQRNILNSSSSMLEVMMNDPDPRFKNSQFLHFLKRIQEGQVVIEGKEIKEVKPDMKAMEGAWNEAELIHKSNMANMDPTFQQAKLRQAQQTLKAQQNLQSHWQNKLQDYEKQYANQEQFERMLEQRYMNVLSEMNFDLTEAWQASTDMQEQLVHGQIKSQYIFNSQNPYLDAQFPKNLALDFINKGMNNQAILALQAHLQKHMEDGDTWRVLGRILQENDQDQKSITCFMNCLKHTPDNLDCLLSLGVSCANTLDEVKAMNYLKRWLMLNPKYQMKGIENIIPEEMANQPTYKVQQIKRVNDQLIKAFDDAAKMNPNDPQLLSASAILFFIKREYEVAIDLFNRALNLDPTNYLLMNKVGATLAHLGRADEAIKFYHRALDIRPNYVRVWVNIGIAHSFKNLYEEATNFYLNALSFRPDAKHIWSYLHTAFLSLQRYDLIGKISSQNPHAFKDEFDVIDLNDLPQPQIRYQITTEKHILNKESTQWLSQFTGK